MPTIAAADSVHIVLGRNPLDPHDCQRLSGSAHLSIAELIQAQRLHFILPTICALNTPGQVILRSEWSEYRVQPGDTVLFLPLMQGGGGGGSNPLKIILGVALMVFAAPLAAHLGTLGAAMGTAGFVKLGAALLLSALVPQPKIPSLNSGDLKQASPTYSISSQGNVLGLEQPIPCVYGWHKVYPPLIASPWVEYVENQQHLYQVFVIGHGEYVPLAADAVMVEDSPISAFSTVFWQQRQYDNAGTARVVAEYNHLSGASHALWHHQVVTSLEVSGQELPAPNETPSNDGWIGAFTVNKAGTQISQIRMDYACPRGLYYANDNGSFAPKTVAWEIQARRIDDYNQPLGDWFNLSEPQELSGSNSFSRSGTLYNEATWLTVDTGVKGTSHYRVRDPQGAGLSHVTVDSSGNTDIVRFLLTRREYYGEDVYYRYDNTIDYDYCYTRQSTTPNKTAATPDPLSWSVSHAVPAGRYQVRCRRIDQKDHNSRAGHELRWIGLAGVTTAPPDYRNVTLLYVHLVATDKISQQASRKINALVQRKLPVWTAARGWSEPVFTANPIWAACDVLRAEYGGALPDTRLNLPVLAKLAADCEQRHDYFDYVAEQQSTILEALSLIGRSFRAVPRISNGVVSFVRDQLRPAPSMLFSANQIIAGSLSLKYLLPNERANGLVEVEYFDRIVWAWRKVLCGRASMQGSQAHKVRLEGVTNQAHAEREGRYLSLTNEKRRTFVTFSTDMEGLLPSYGQLIAVAHDLAAWGQTAHALHWNAATLTLTVDHALTWSGSRFTAMLRHKDGAPSAVYAVQRGAADNQLVFEHVPTPLPYTGLDYEPTTVILGSAELVVVTGIKPRGLDRVEITGVVEDESVHTV